MKRMVTGGYHSYIYRGMMQIFLRMAEGLHEKKKSPALCKNGGVKKTQRIVCVFEDIFF